MDERIVNYLEHHEQGLDHLQMDKLFRTVEAELGISKR